VHLVNRNLHLTLVPTGSWYGRYRLRVVPTALLAFLFFLLKLIKIIEKSKKIL
jgi:hypothetical protein